MSKIFSNKIYHPEIYHGHEGKKRYFEGWYYKIVDKLEKNIYAIIPGVAFDMSNQEDHCFIQILDGTNNRSVYIKYDINTFSYSKDKFEVWVGSSYFSLNKLILNIDNKNYKIKGELNFVDITPWPSTVVSPNSMGWYAFVPFMECYHGVLSMSHGIIGKMEINDNETDFSGGAGYMEKDWGRSFPSSWVWIQSNHFKSDASITCSIANIPWLGRRFVGLLGGLKLDSQVHRFATYTGAKINKNNINQEFADIEIEDNKYILDIEVKKSNSAELLSPKNGLMKDVITESMDSSMRVKLIEKRKFGRELVFDEIGRNTAVEIMGNINELVVK